MQVLASRQLQSDECMMIPFPIYVVNMSELDCCTHSCVHRHNIFEVIWVHKGHITFYLDFQEYEIQAGTLIFVTPGQVHSWQYRDINTEILAFSFKAEVFAMHGQDVRTALTQLPFFNAVGPMIHIPNDTGDLVTSMFRTALQRLDILDKRQEQLLLSYLNVVLAEARRMVDRTPGVPALNAAMQLTQQFRTMLEQHFADRKQVQEYADQLGVTTNHLVETIRQTTGYTPGYHIQGRLLLEAKRLLVFTSMSMAEIAHRLSFKNPSQFGHWFREHEEQSPRAFRQEFLIP